MTFVGRTLEKQKLCDVYKNDNQSTVLIYGRRRVGKSELIKESLRVAGVDSIYYECKQTSEMNNVESLSMLVSEKFGYPKLAFSSLEEILGFLFKRAETTPLVLVLDEYSYLKNVVLGLDSILQSLIDAHASKLKLVLCGSYVEVMESLLAKENPLYGRIDVTISLKPMDYYESSLFYPFFSNEDKVRLYSVFGGIPYYNRLIDSGLSVKENIIELIASPGARLENEVGMYLHSEISKIVNANEVFEALSKGFSKYNDILSQSHVSSGPTLVDVLDKLMRMNVVVKEAPINDEANRKKAGYFISDNMSLFSYRYIFRYVSQMNVMDPNAFFDRFIAEDFETIYVPDRFERICKEYLIRENRIGRLEEPFEKIGKYYYDDPLHHKNGEFAVVTESAKGYVFYEVKFRKVPIGRDVVKEEIAQVESSGLKAYRYGFFSRVGFDGVDDLPIMKICLQDLYR
jgi:AAA+ ATPase superfamily predicted ATPase